MTTLRLLFCLLLSTTLLTACGGPQETAPAETEPAPAAQEEPAAAEAMEEATTAHATLQAREDMGELQGVVNFSESDGVVTITAEVKGLSGAGTHGFHIHETGDCSAPDFTSAGGHFNPTDTIHGGPSDEEHHAGDLGNLEIGEDGSGTLEHTSSMITLGEGPNSVVGKAVILHEKADDLVSQPTGAAGGRVACGIIELDGDDMGSDMDSMDDDSMDDGGSH
ncbi:MAG: superoxide dismutase family protein [Acidobacteriota bacterium]|nr:superoxide dismutase family protein [Acidobacteriota bacterium]